MGSDVSDYRRCNACNRFGWMKTHVCPPAYMVWCEENGEVEPDAEPIRANDAEEAAKEWGEQDDSRGDYDIVRGNDATVRVRGPDGTLTRWRITGESVPEYHARELPPEAT